MTKEIRYYPNYSISTNGVVTNTRTGRVIKPDNNHKYTRVSLSANGIRRNFLVHRIMAKAFLSNPQGKSEVNHKDCNTKNNTLSNLEWVTHEENKAHARGFQMGLKNV